MTANKQSRAPAPFRTSYTSLVRQGEGPAAAYERQRQQRVDDRARLERIIRDSEQAPEQAPELNAKRRSRAGATAAGDFWKLRGIPVQARGVGGTLPGSDPLAALIANERKDAA